MLNIILKQLPPRNYIDVKDASVSDIFHKHCFWNAYVDPKEVCDLFTRPASPWTALSTRCQHSKGENSCKYKHGEIHLKLEQSGCSNSLTVTWGWNRFQNHEPTGRTLSWFVWLMHKHTQTETQTRVTAVHRVAQKEEEEKKRGRLWLASCTVKQKYLDVSPPANC